MDGRHIEAVERIFAVADRHRGLVASMYPRYADWLAVHRRFNATGVFDSPFSRRVGIAQDRFTA